MNKTIQRHAWSYHLHPGFLSSLLSRLSSSLVLSFIFSSLSSFNFSSLSSFIFSCLSSFIFSCLSCVVVCVAVVVCVRCGVVRCGVCRGTLKNPRVYTQNVPVCTGTTRTSIKTCARGAGTHGDVLNGHTGFSARHTTRHKTQDTTHKTTQLTKNCPRKIITCFRGSPKVSTGSYTFSSLKKDREQHVADSSNHSLYLKETN